VNDVKVGDEVLVKGTVKQVNAGYAVLVELFSPTDQYSGWVRPDLVSLLLTDVPNEPENRTWVRRDDRGGCNVFRRDDDEGHHDPDRRFHRCWWDFGANEWIDWPTAYKRGADPSKRLAEVTDGNV
jgi:hypothetical protein